MDKIGVILSFLFMKSCIFGYENVNIKIFKYGINMITWVTADWLARYQAILRQGLGYGVQ